ncbi:MAG: hypothetical protein FWH04_08785 [Oscillospiraceae bacterium]|nr:hypothetical protein [Oscillospiraceae bacterium]
MKKLQKLSLSLALSLILAVSLALPAFASNHSDTNLPTSFISYTTNATTGVRAKQNTTSVYMNNTSGMTLWVYANGGSKPSNPSVTYSTGTTRGNYAKVLPGKYRIVTWIYENGYRSAWLNISTATSGVSGNCKGQWSPDSVGSYPPAN